MNTVAFVPWDLDSLRPTLLKEKHLLRGLLLRIITAMEFRAIHPNFFDEFFVRIPGYFSRDRNTYPLADCGVHPILDDQISVPASDPPRQTPIELSLIQLLGFPLVTIRYYYVVRDNHKPRDRFCLLIP